MNQCPNPACRKPVDPSWKICGYCGTILSHPTEPPPVPTISSFNIKKYLPFILIGVVAVVVLVVLLLGNNSYKTSPQTGSDFSNSNQTILNNDSDPNSTDNASSSGIQNQPTFTPFPTQIILTSTPTPTSTPERSCPGSKPQRVKIGDRVVVCTRSDRLIVRESASLNGSEILRLYPTTYVNIVSGPICADDSSWWKVSIAAGTNVYYPAQTMDGRLIKEVQGWVREGSDSTDPYFICRVE